MDNRLWLAWAVLNVLGAVLTLVVTRKDRERGADERRAGALWEKFGSYLGITFFFMFLGEVARGAVMYVTWVIAVVAGRELYDEIRGDDMDAQVVGWVGLLYIAAGMFGLWAVKSMDRSGDAWAWLWLVVATTDAYSQLFGQGWGQARMAPALSPGKTWFGFFAGTAFAVLVGTVLGFAIRRVDEPMVPLVALATSLAATAGDLLESWMKRRLGIKDFSKKLGEHGGVLDRLDSLFGAAPVLAALLKLW